MKLLALAVFSCIALSTHAECDEHRDGCADVHDIGIIACDGGGVPCKIVEGDGLEYLLDDLTSQTIDADVCRQKCQEQADKEAEVAKKCEFFRWKKGHTDTAAKCALQTSCGEDQTCAQPDCVSGQLGCDEEGNERKTCELTEKTAWTYSKFHIICFGPDGDINIYADEITSTSIPAGTVCSTIRMCANWDDPILETDNYYRKLAVECNGLDGTWKAVDKTGSQFESGNMIVSTDPAETKIVEPECVIECDTLTLTEYAKQPWADLFCDSPLTGADGNELEDGNSCILLCDNHMTMSVECGFTGMGEKNWHDRHGNILDDETKISCDTYKYNQ